MAWATAVLGLVALMGAPCPGWAAPPGALGLPIRLVGSSSPLEARSPQFFPESMLGTPTGLALDKEEGATLRLPHNLELTISFLYNREPSSLDPKGRGDSSLLYNYSLNYGLLPNLQVGLNAYLFRPSSDEGFAFARPGERLMGLGPGLKYNLGRWNFVVKSQLETGSTKGDDLQNWFRVWYAF